MKSTTRFEGVITTTEIYPKEHPETQRRAALAVAQLVDEPDTRLMLLDMLGLVEA